MPIPLLKTRHPIGSNGHFDRGCNGLRLHYEWAPMSRMGRKLPWRPVLDMFFTPLADICSRTVLDLARFGGFFLAGDTSRQRLRPCAVKFPCAKRSKQPVFSLHVFELQ